VGVAIVAGALLRLRDPERSDIPRSPIDLTGAVLGVLTLFAFNFALIAGPEQGWSSPRVLAALVAGVVALAAFVVVERRHPAAMLDMRLFRIPSFTGAMVLTFLARVTSFGILPYLILWLQGMLGHSPLETGLRLLAMTMPIIVVALLVGRLGRHVPASRLLAAGFALIAVAFVTMARVGPGSSWTVMLPGLVLLGVGGALAFPPLLGVTLDVVPAGKAGMASGLSNTFFPLGTAAGVAVYGAIFATRLHAELPERAATAAAKGLIEDETARRVFTDALSTICLLAAVAGAVASVMALVLIRARDLQVIREPDPARH
jgi:predicted MFS family arabinose efflux permease